MSNINWLNTTAAMRPISVVPVSAAFGTLACANGRTMSAFVGQPSVERHGNHVDGYAKTTSGQPSWRPPFE